MSREIRKERTLGEMTMKRLMITTVVLVGLLCTVGLGQKQATDDKSKETEKPIPVKNAQPEVSAKPAASSTAGVLSVTVLKVSGSAEVRESSEKPWRAIKVGDTYHEGAEIRTGYRSRVDLKFSDNSNMTLNRVSHFRVDKFRRSGNKVVTRSHLSYGKVQAGVEKGPAFSDYKITTSLGTLGVNGTSGILLYVDSGGRVINACLRQKGLVGWNTGSGSDRLIPPQGCTNQNGIGLDLRKLQRNNLTLVDPFGSSSTEHQVGDKNGNQGTNTPTTVAGGTTVQSSSHTWHYKD